jgi:5'-nucleotidase
MTVALITNDDGIDSPGLHALATAASEAGLNVVVAAPASEASGSSASITGADPAGRIRMERRTIAGLDVPCFAVQAAPALIVLIAAHGAFGDPPDVVLSGINRGANVGHAILHSGTVGAALTGGSNGARAMAVSLDVGMRPVSLEWAAAAAVSKEMLATVLECPRGTVLNLNVPNTDGAARGRPRVATLAPFGIVQTTTTESGEDEVRLTVADLQGEQDPRTDVALLLAGHSTLTSVTAVGESRPPKGLRHTSR